MNLELVKNIEAISNTNIRKGVSQEEIKFNFMKNMIKKDLEVVLWQNKAVKVFGEFQIYSDFRSELNSFDFIVSFLTGSIFEYAGESVEAHVSCKCPEHYLNFLITKNYKFDENEIERLASKYTNYIIEASSLISNYNGEFIQLEVKELDKKYFGGNDPTAIWKYINPQYLN